MLISSAKCQLSSQRKVEKPNKQLAVRFYTRPCQLSIELEPTFWIRLSLPRLGQSLRSCFYSLGALVEEAGSCLRLSRDHFPENSNQKITSWPQVGLSTSAMSRARLTAKQAAHVFPPTVRPLLSLVSAAQHTGRCSRSSYTALRPSTSSACSSSREHTSDKVPVFPNLPPCRVHPAPESHPSFF